MGRFVRGDVVVISFPFTHFQDAKKRPALVISNEEGEDDDITALVLAGLKGKDIILCMITHQYHGDGHSVSLKKRSDFVRGKLREDSYVRPNRLFTFESDDVKYLVGRITHQKLEEVV